ncbi:MAG: AsmA-like C-terminal domain-containing protein, partial [Bdellovibrionales bacterium]
LMHSVYKRSEQWVVEKLSEGRFSNAFATLDFDLRRAVLPQSVGSEDENRYGPFLPASSKPDYVFDLKGLEARFDFSDMRIDYKAPLKPVANAKGKSSFDYKSDTLRIGVEGGLIGDIKVGASHVVLTDVIKENAGAAQIDVTLAGPLKSVIAYAADEPIGVKPDFDTAKVKGNADLHVKLGFPTNGPVKIASMDIDISGKIRDALIPAVVRDMDLTGGPFDLSIKGNVFSLSGKGKVAGRDVDLRYDEFLKSAGQPYSSKVTAKLIADADLRARMGIDLSMFLDGSAAVDVVYTKKQDGSAVADVNADLTASRLFFDPFDYEKPVGQAGRATLAAHLKDGALQRIDSLSAEGPDFSLSSSTLLFRGADSDLASGTLNGFRVGESRGRLEFQRSPAGVLKLAVDGQSFDLRPFLNDDDNDDSDPKKPYDGPPLQVSINADVMRTADEEVIKRAKLYVDLDDQGRFNQLEMDGVVGAGDLYLRYKPDASGMRVFRLEADDAGATLKAFQVYDQIRGGKLVIYGEPIKGVYDRNLIGAAEIKDFKVVKAPSLARLISAMSLTGLDDALNGQGLVFSKLEADFDWLFRPDGSLLVLKNGRTSGNSLGLTFEGTFDNARSAIDVSGTIIPLSEVSNIIGKIPLVGDILTGGSGGIFAATYKIKGEGKQEPDVSVNPLSVLAPGILRRILFEQN